MSISYQNDGQPCRRPPTVLKPARPWIMDAAVLFWKLPAQTPLSVEVCNKNTRYMMPSWYIHVYLPTYLPRYIANTYRVPRISLFLTSPSPSFSPLGPFLPSPSPPLLHHDAVAAPQKVKRMRRTTSPPRQNSLPALASCRLNGTRREGFF